MTVEDSVHAPTKTGHPASSGLIDDVTKDFKEFWELPIQQSGATYHKTTYDSVNASLIFERLAGDSDKDDLALICPDDPTTTLLVIIESLTSLLKYDMLNSTSQVLSTIKPGDPVGLMQNRKMLPGTYMGIEEINGRNLHCVKTDDGLITKIPPDRSKWRIQPYMATGISGRKRSTLVFGKVLEELIGLPPGGLMAFQHSKALLVTPEKARITESIRGVTLGDDPIETIFPIADYIDANNRRHIGSNALQREPILGLVSNIDTAVDIALADPAIKLIIIDGASKVRTGYGSISRLNSDELPRKIICLLKSVDEEEITTLAAMNIDAWIWKRGDFKTAEERYRQRQGDKTQPFEIHDHIVDNLGGSEPQTVKVEAYKQLDKAVRNAMRQMRLISRETPSSEEAGFIFRWGVSLINSLLQLPLKMREYEAYVSSLGPESGLELDMKIASFEKKLRDAYGFVIPSTLTDECEKLIKNMQDIFRLISLRNPKAEALSNYLEDNKNRRITIACCRPEYAEALRKLYNFENKIKVITFSEVGSVPDENLVVTGWLNRRMAAKLFLAPYRELIYMLYEREVQSYDHVLRSHPSSPVLHSDTKLRTILGLEPQENSDNEDAKSDNEDNIEELIRTVNNKYGGPSYTEQLHQYSTAEMVKAKCIVFEDDSYAYLTDTQGINKLDRANRATQNSRLADLSPGDELIFADSGRDMFEELLTIIRDTDGYRALYDKASLWHRSLESYMEENNLEEKDLVTHLALVGSKPNIVTVRMWINRQVISPSEDYLRAIAKVTGDPELNSKLDEIEESCSKLRALHIQTGRLLVRRIIKAAVQDDEDLLNDEAREKIDTYSQSARVVTVREISDETIDVPLKATGKLFEAEL